LKVLVTGAGGMVGRAVCELVIANGDGVFAYDHKGLDIANQSEVMQALRADQPDVVINCAAWTDVDGCETDKQRAFAANAVGPENLALASRAIKSGFITISTDYVFDGRKPGFYTQRDDPNPQSVYGISKLEGERRARLAYARTIVVRSGFVFGDGGRNFLSTLVERARQGARLKAIDDVCGTPTYAPDLAARLRELAEMDLPGVFHVVNSGDGATYAEFARLALDEAGYQTAPLELVKTDSLKRLASRPRNSKLQCLLSPAIGLLPLPFWVDAVRCFVASQAQVETTARH
jgi:dTDP-4-dehydrorhamnose reductase